MASCQPHGRQRSAAGGRTPWRCGARNRGFSLLELLLATTLTILMLVVAVTLMNQLFAVAAEATQTAAMNQNLRAAANLIAQDLGMTAAGIPIGGIPLPSKNSSPMPVTRPGVTGILFPANNLEISAITPGFGLGPSQAGATVDDAYGTGALTDSDEITLLQVDDQSQISAYPLASINTAGTQVTFNVNTNFGAGSEQLAKGDVLLLENVNGSALGMITGFSGDVAQLALGDPLNLNQPTATAGNIASLATGGTYPSTTAYRVLMITYYLDFSVPSRPRLMRQLDDDAAQPVATGITGLQFSYNLSDGVTVDDRNPANANQIRQVNIVISGRSEQPSHKTNQYYTNSIATAVAIRNLEFTNHYATEPAD
ncbi:MAG: hypothetical protein ACRD2E_07365 [Terriglobales bacterium]